MSYILDALKKADRERHPLAVPTLGTVHRVPDLSHPRRLWPWLAAVVIVVNVGVWLWLHSASPPDGIPVGSIQTPVTPPAPATSESAVPPPRAAESARAPAQPDKMAAVAPSAPSAAPPGSGSTLASRQKRTIDPPDRERGRTALSIEKPTRESPAAPGVPKAPSTKAAPAPEKSGTPAAATTPAKTAERAPASTSPSPTPSREPAIPPEVLARINLQVLVYSELPAERLVFINNQKYVEGQHIDANLVVESITHDGAVLNYQGKRLLLRSDQSAR
jgi:hypothetical protein